MATTTIDNTTVVFSNSTAAANLSTSINEDASSYVYNFDVLAYSGGGAKTTIWSVDDGVKGDDNPPVVVSSAFSTYNTDLLYKDTVGNWETSSLGAKFAIINGKIQYDASALSGRINHLGVGESLNDSLQYTIRLSNGTLSVGTLKVALTGANDAVVITSGTQGATTNEDATAASTGTISFKDADTIDIHTATAAAAATNTTALGSFSVGAVSETHVSGNDAVGSVGWTYTVDNSAANYLGRTESATETYNVTVKDGHGGDAVQAVTVTINGVNDAVSIVAGSTTASGSADEDATDAVTGSIAFTDPDLTDTHTTGVTAHGDNASVGTFSLDSVSEDGSTAGGSVGWSYTVDNAAATHLAVGEFAVDKFDVTIGDGLTSDTQTVEVTVTGVNDDVAITSAAGGATTDEDAATASTGTIAFTDPDYTDVHTASFAADESNETALGSFALGAVSESATDADGSVGWTYTVDNSAAAYLRAGEHATETYNVTIKDAHGSEATQAVTVRIDGVNDLATIGAGDDSDNAVTESGDTPSNNLSAGGKLSISDLDHGEAVLADASTGDRAGTYGTFHVDADGTWSYDLNDSAVNALGAGVTRTDTISVASFDGTGHFDITVTITGTNDSPVIAAADSTYAIDENATGLIHDFDASDVDTLESSDTLTWSLEGANKDAFSIGTDGKLSLTTAQDYETTTSLSVTVKVSDQHGGSATKDITVNINDLTEVVYVTAPTNHVTAPVGADPKDFDSLTGGTATSGNFNGNGNDNTLTGDAGNQNIDGQNGNDTIYGGGGNDNVSGSNGNDVLYGQGGNDNISGGNDLDVIYGGSGNDGPITGGNGNDTIYGGSGNDTINGNGGNDLIVGGFGADSVTGGGDNDTFKFVSLADSGDTITDFNAGDKIDVTGLGFTSFSTTQSNAHGLWQVTDAGGGFFVYGDTDGNVNTYEFTFHVNTSLAAGDFIGI